MMARFIFKSGYSAFSLLIALFFSMSVIGQSDFTEYRGKVVDGSSNKALEAVSLNINKTNINTITNSEGGFILKVPNKYSDSKIVFALLGYNTRVIPLTELKKDNNKIKLYEAVTELSEVSITTYKNAESLVRKVFDDKYRNLQDESVYMTAFYRETIKGVIEMFP
jgi:hypothetical protein